MQLNPRPIRNGHNLFVGDRVVAIGLYSKVHGTGKIAAIRQVKGINLAAVKFDSGHVAEFTELQLRRKAA